MVCGRFSRIVGRIGPCYNSIYRELNSRVSFKGDSPLTNHQAYGIAFDIDGVLIRGKGNVLPGARESLRKLKQRKTPFVFLTNSGGMTEEDKAGELSTWLDMEVDPEQVILAHTPMRSLSTLYTDKLVLILGRSDPARVAAHYGFRKVVTVAELLRRYPLLWPFAPPPEAERINKPLQEPIAAILMMSDSKEWGPELQVVCDVLRSEGIPGEPSRDGTQRVPMYFSNPDLVYSDVWHVPRFGAGAFKVCLKALHKELTGQDLEYTQYGKPHTPAYAYAQAVLYKEAVKLGHARTPSVIYAVGDNPVADIAGANKAGWYSILVRTGVFHGTSNDAHHPADHVCEHVGHAVDHILARHSL